MNKMNLKKLGKFSLIAVLPILSGCTGGGIALLGLGSLFGGLGGGAGAGILSGGSGAAGTIAFAHTPEPASMLLLGSGVAVMAYLKSRKK